MLFWLVLGFWAEYIPGQPFPVRRGVWNFLIFVLLTLLGWQVFGSPVKG